MNETFSFGDTMGGWDGDVDTVATRPADDIKRTADAVDALVDHGVVLKCVSADHVVIVCIFRSPEEASRASSEPARANFTSMKPSLKLVSSLRSSG
jgi:hypothetical protein